MFDIEILKDITNPSTLETIQHLKSMFENAATAAIEGRAIILISNVDTGDQFLRQYAIDNSRPAK